LGRRRGRSPLLLLLLLARLLLHALLHQDGSESVQQLSLAEGGRFRNEALLHGLRPKMRQVHPGQAHRLLLEPLLGGLTRGVGGSRAAIASEPCTHTQTQLLSKREGGSTRDLSPALAVPCCASR